MYTVSIVKGENHRKMLEEAVALCGGLSTIFPSKNEEILIKPNFGCHKTAVTGATTDLRVLSSLIEILQSQGYSNIVVGDGGMAGYIKVNILNYLGVPALCEKYGVPVIDLNRDKGVPMKLSNGVTVRISEVALKSKVIDLAKLKTHVLTTVTLGIKNLLGCVTGLDKREVHLHGLHTGLAALASMIKPRLTIIEGLIGMEGHGPVAGKPIKTDIVVASRNLIAADIVASKVMGFDPFTIKHIRCAVASSLYNVRKIKIVGIPLERAITPFERATPKKFEANPYFERVKHMIRGKETPYRVAHTVLSSKIVSAVFRDLGFLQEEIDHELLTDPPKVDKNMCTGCGFCKNVCPTNAIFITEGKADISREKCVKCYCCVEICPYGTIMTT